MRLQKLKGKSGFTLIEIIVVIAILAVLASMGWVAQKVVKSRELTKKAEIEINLMETGLNSYRQDFGDTLPYGNGDDWSSHVLYSTLYCDDNNDGEPDKDKETKELRVPYCERLVPVESIKKASELPSNSIIAVKVEMKVQGKKKSKYYAIPDPWGKPYRYRLGYELRDDHNRPGKGVNADFDLFSLGPDSLGDGKDNLGDNEDNITNIRSWK